MIQKLLILVFLGLLSVVSPAVFAGILFIVVISVAVCNLDITMAKFGKSLATRRSSRPIKIPCNFLAIGLVFALAFTATGFFWGTNPPVSDQALELLRICVSVALHFGALMLLVGSMFKFVKLVD